MWFKNRRAKWRKMKREEQQRLRRMQHDHHSSNSPPVDQQINRPNQQINRPHISINNLPSPQFSRNNNRSPITKTSLDMNDFNSDEELSFFKSPNGKASNSSDITENLPSIPLPNANFSFRTDFEQRFTNCCGSQPLSNSCDPPINITSEQNNKVIDHQIRVTEHHSIINETSKPVVEQYNRVIEQHNEVNGEHNRPNERGVGAGGRTDAFPSRGYSCANSGKSSFSASNAESPDEIQSPAKKRKLSHSQE